MVADLSIIIVSYNQFSGTTGPCLQSLAAVHDIDLEIIVVDNGSDQQTRLALKEAAVLDERIRLVLHKDNKGFASGNNDGVQLASADCILLLNSDTLVPKYVPAAMVRRLQESLVPCLVGPVTNAAGNEQRIYITEGSDEASVLAQGDSWRRHARGSVFQTDQLPFFCVAMARKTYIDLGGLDSAFGLGFYEDTDFCCRAAQHGIILLVNEECFVFHQGSACFSQVPASVKRLLAENRKRFRARHGKNEGCHVRWKNLKVLQGYLDQYQEGGVCRKYLFANRLEMARRLTPNNPIKKIGYGWQLTRLKKAVRGSGFGSTEAE